MQNSGFILECLFTLLNNEAQPTLHHPLPFYAYSVPQNLPDVQNYLPTLSYQNLLAEVQENLTRLTLPLPLPHTHLEDQPAGKLILSALGTPSLRLEKSLKTNLENSYAHLDEVHRASIETILKSASWVWGHVSNWVMPPLKPMMTEGGFFGHITRKDYAAALHHASTEANRGFFSAYLHHLLWVKSGERNMPAALAKRLQKERKISIESLKTWQKRCSHLREFMNNHHYISELVDVERELLQSAVAATDDLETQAEKNNALFHIYDNHTVPARDADLLRQEFLAASHNFLGETRSPPFFMRAIEGCGNKLNTLFDYFGYFQEARSFSACCASIQTAYEASFSKHRHLVNKTPLENLVFFNTYTDLVRKDLFFKARVLLLNHTSQLDTPKQLQRLQHYKALIQALIFLAHHFTEESEQINTDLINLFAEDSKDIKRIMLLLEIFFEHQGIIRETHLAHKALKESFLKQIKNQQVGKKSLQDRATESLKRKTTRYFVEGHALDNIPSWTKQANRVSEAIDQWQKLLIGHQTRLRHTPSPTLTKPLLSLKQFTRPYKNVGEVSEAIKCAVKNNALGDKEFGEQITIILNNLKKSPLNIQNKTISLLENFDGLFARFLKIRFCFEGLESRLNALPTSSFNSTTEEDLKDISIYKETCSAALNHLKSSIRKETRTEKNNQEGLTATRILKSAVRKGDRALKGENPINQIPLFSEISESLKKEYDELYEVYTQLNKRYPKKTPLTSASTPTLQTTIIIEDYTH